MFSIDISSLSLSGYILACPSVAQKGTFAAACHFFFSIPSNPLAVKEPAAGGWSGGVLSQAPHCLPFLPPQHAADLACLAVSPISDEKVTSVVNVKTLSCTPFKWGSCLPNGLDFCGLAEFRTLKAIFKVNKQKLSSLLLHVVLTQLRKEHGNELATSVHRKIWNAWLLAVLSKNSEGFLCLHFQWSSELILWSSTYGVTPFFLLLLMMTRIESFEMWPWLLWNS